MIEIWIYYPLQWKDFLCHQFPPLKNSMIFKFSFLMVLFAFLGGVGYLWILIHHDTNQPSKELQCIPPFVRFACHVSTPPHQLSVPSPQHRIFCWGLFGAYRAAARGGVFRSLFCWACFRGLISEESKIDDWPVEVYVIKIVGKLKAFVILWLQFRSRMLFR